MKSSTNHYFMTMESTFKGMPILTLYVDAKPWGEVYGFDQDFRFGLKKALLIRLFLNVIREFGNSNGSKPPIGNILKIKIKGTEMICTCTKYPSFVLSNGYQIDRPYLKLEGLFEEFGLGVEKAKAIIHVQNQLNAFITKHLPTKDRTPKETKSVSHTTRASKRRPRKRT